MTNNEASTGKSEAAQDVQYFLAEAGKNIFKFPETLSDIVVTGSAIIAIIIASLYIIRFFGKLLGAYRKNLH
jgi:hypothetical protein